MKPLANQAAGCYSCHRQWKSFFLFIQTRKRGFLWNAMTYPRSISTVMKSAGYFESIEKLTK